MIKWACIGAFFVAAGWLVYPNWIGIQKTSSNRVSALCEDATLSTSESRSGTCSRHGGVKEWIE